jgi:hypothetical protein
MVIGGLNDDTTYDDGFLHALHCSLKHELLRFIDGKITAVFVARLMMIMILFIGPRFLGLNNGA